MLKAKYSENLMLEAAPRNFPAAQAQLHAFRGVQVELVDEEPEISSFKCLTGGLPRRDCVPTQVVVSR